MGSAYSLSWSFTRARSLAGCPRAHWFSYYAEGEQEFRKARLLKQLVTPEMLAGQVVDWQVNRALDAVRDGTEAPDDLVAKGREAWARMLSNSRSMATQMAQGRSLPRGAQPLLADYYGLPMDTERERRCEERVALALQGFEISQVWSRVKRIPVNRWSPRKDNWDIRAEEWQLQGVTIWSALDLWIDFGARGLVVLDWKSGSVSDIGEALQLATYSLWGQVTRGLDRGNVLVQAVHLPDSPDWGAKPVSEVECVAAQETILEQSQAEARLAEPVEDETGAVRFHADRETFPPRPAEEVCLRCKFRELCPEGQEVVEASFHP